MAGLQFTRVVREGLTEKVTLEQRPRGERRNHGDIWGNSNPGGGHSMCKGPGVAPCLACWRNSEEACSRKKSDKINFNGLPIGSFF